MRELVAVLVAAGRSRRMGGEKLWIDLWGRPVWRWSLDALLSVPMLSRVAVMAPADSLERYRSLLPATHADRCLLVSGGEERSHSVRAGLEALADVGVGRDAIVLVHDAARPAASPELMASVARTAAEHGAAIPVVGVADTLQRVADELVTGAVARDTFAAAQTPQAASLGILRAALDAARANASAPTDEATALVALGVPVATVPGERANLKITEAGDEDVVRAVLRERALAGLEAAEPQVARARARVGIGFDAHRLAAGIPLRLGGLSFPDEPRGLVGHSDGDAALHAIIDALLGAAGLGDVGTLFPSGDERWSGADSGELVRQTVARIRDAGLRTASVDLVVVSARPAVDPVRGEMAARIAALLEVSDDAVTVKGTTSDGLGFAGQDGIAAYAVASVERIGPPGA